MTANTDKAIDKILEKVAMAGLLFATDNKSNLPYNYIDLKKAEAKTALTTYINKEKAEARIDEVKVLESRHDIFETDARDRIAELKAQLASEENLGVSE